MGPLQGRRECKAVHSACSVQCAVCRADHAAKLQKKGNNCELNSPHFYVPTHVIGQGI